MSEDHPHPRPEHEIKEARSKRLTKTAIAIWAIVLLFAVAGVLIGLARQAAEHEQAAAAPTDEPPAPDLIQLATTPVTNNSAWTPVIHNFKGVPMVLVPAGCFTMGSEDGDSDERPAHEQCFDAPFWIDRTEVTQAQFAALGGAAAMGSFFTGDNLPVEQITWSEARDFCAQRDARLPTEAEWEYAARGPDGLIYPWGDEWVGEDATWSGSSGGQTADVGSRTGGASWVGALDMSGNVWEWTSSLYRPYPYDAADGREDPASTEGQRALHGGSWFNNSDELRAARRNGDANRSNTHSFRCARPA